MLSLWLSGTVCAVCDVEITPPAAEEIYLPYPASDQTISGTCVHPEFEYYLTFKQDGRILSSIEAQSPFSFLWEAQELPCGRYVLTVDLESSEFCWEKDSDSVTATIFRVEIKDSDGSAPESCIAKGGSTTYAAYVYPSWLSGSFHWETTTDAISVETGGDRGQLCTARGERTGAAGLTVRFTPDGSCVNDTDSLDLVVYCVDLDIEGVRDETDTDTMEVEVGGYLRLNATPLRQMNLSGWPAGKEVTLSAPSGGSRIEVYNASGEPIAISRELASDTQVFVKGVGLSSECRDITLTLTCGAGSNVSTDTVRLTVFQIDPDWADMQSGNHETEEKDPGLYIPVNDDDDNADSIGDANQNESGVYLENDLKKLFIRRTPARLPGKYTAAQVGHLSLWEDTATETEKQKAFSSMTLADQYEADTWIWVEGESASVDLKDSYVTLTYEAPDGTAESESVVATVYGVKTVSPTGAHKIFISIRSGDTFPDTSVQSENRKAKITVAITPAIQGVPVYLRTYDLDDASSYETNQEMDDNRHSGMEYGSLAAESGYTVVAGSQETYGACTRTLGIETDAQGQVKATLEITNRYAGDNYGVYASSGDKPFAGNSGTGNLVAWKRVYLEQDIMYRKGATITAAFSVDGDSLNDVLYVDSTVDFTVGETVVLFTASGLSVETTVVETTVNTLTVPDLNVNLPQFSGVKLKNDSTTYDINLTLFTQAFGSNTIGDDGGSFVELHVLATGSGNTPNYGSFPNDTVALDYANAWFYHSTSHDNVFQLLAANKCVSGWYGATSSSLNISIVATGNFSFGNNTLAIAETAVHEIGHQFDVANGHVDQPVPTPNIDGTDSCVMSYSRVRDNGIAEFDADCIYDIRDAVDPR